MHDILEFLRFMPATVPPSMVEFGNGALWTVLIFVMAGLALSVVSHWWSLRWHYEKLFSWRPLKAAYRAREATIALFFGVAGFWLKTLMVWLPRHLEHIGVAPADRLPAGLAPFLFLIGTAVSVAGFACWLRITLPNDIANWSVTIAGRARNAGRFIWVAIVFACIVWSCWMAVV